MEESFTVVEIRFEEKSFLEVEEDMGCEIGLEGGNAVGSVRSVEIISLLDCKVLIDVLVNEEVVRFDGPI